MPPSLKDSDTATTSETPARNGSAASTDSSIKQQPVALEIPITVNGARTVEGSDKREPFSESTKTVMVFGSGAVIRLNSSMAPGQLLFVTNERSKKEVVCQVVKSKNYRSASGYVELEFTEPAVGFWGMRFPGDRIGPGPQASTPEARSSAEGNSSPGPSRPRVEKAEQPAASSSSPVAVKPSSPPLVSPKPGLASASGPSTVPPPVDSATPLGSLKSKADSRVPAPPAAISLSADEPLVEPWLKKRAPVSKAPTAPASTTSPESKAKSEELEASPTIAPKFELTRPSDKPASLFAPAEPPAPLSNVDLSSLTPFFEVKPAPGEAPAAPPKAATASDPETEDLKHHTTRLQEELSQMQFAEPVTDSPAKPKAEMPAKLEAETPSFPLTETAISAIKTDLVHDSAARLVEDSAAPGTVPLLPELPGREESSTKAPSPVIPALESLEQEELKIPAWLEPLARNASAPSSTQELVLREKAKRVAEQPPLQELVAPLAAPIKKEEQVAEARLPQFGSALPFEEGKKVKKISSEKSGKGMLFAGLAAGILVLAGGGWWYRNQQAAGVHAGGSSSEASSASAASQDLRANSAKESALGAMLPTHSDATTSAAKAATANSNGPVNSSNAVLNSVPTNPPATAARNPQAESNSPNGGSMVIRADSGSPEPEPAAEKKPVLGEVHLATPKISQKRTAQNAAELDAGILSSEEPPEGTDDSLGAGLGAATKQPTAPTAPVAIGGDVKQAKLISTVPPVYPQLAKAQHISGGVTIDALIDANGRVTKMKVISGPTLLQEAAMDALRQWKYQPATLDGKAVPMHLTVTIQFRLQG